MSASHGSHSSGPTKNGRSFLERAANLSTVLTLIALVGIGAAAQRKLDTIDARARANCRNINGGILLTLEASRGRNPSPRRDRELNRVEERFQRLQDQC